MGTQVARIEQSLEHHRERSHALENDYAQAEEALKQVRLQVGMDEVRLLSLKEAGLALQPESESAVFALKQAETVRQEAFDAVQTSDQQFEHFQRDAEKPHRTAEVEKARIEQLERQSKEAVVRFERVQVECRFRWCSSRVLRELILAVNSFNNLACWC